MAQGHVGQFCNGHCGLEIQSSQAIPALLFGHPAHFGLSVSEATIIGLGDAPRLDI